MFQNILLLAIIVLYIPSVKLVELLYSRNEKLSFLKYYINTVFFVIFSFVASTVLGNDIRSLLETGIENSLKFWTSLIGLIFTILILSRIITQLFKNIRKFLTTQNNEFAIHIITAYVINVVIVFAFIYFCIYLFIPTGFSGISPNTDPFAAYLNLIYFSFVTFATIGYGDIAPLAAVAKFVVVIEIVLFCIVVGISLSFASKKKQS